jgi:hypothetical protein
MFQRIVIELSGPICACDEQSLAWGIHQRGSGNGSGILITCKLCDTELVVPHSKFLAGFSLDTPYPDGKKKDEGEVLEPRKKPEEEEEEEPQEDSDDKALGRGSKTEGGA